MRMNEDIRVPEVRLIDEDGTQLGVVGTEDAREKAVRAELDLVEIAPKAQPPVCRIMDYGKYKYQQQKKLTDQKKKQQNTDMKQLRIKTFRIDPHDIEIKMRKARTFLEEGHRLLVTLMFRARENNHADLGAELLNSKIAEPLKDIAKVDSRPIKQGRRMTMMLSPLPNVKQIVARRMAAEAKDAAAADADAAVEETE